MDQLAALFILPTSGLDLCINSALTQLVSNKAVTSSCQSKSTNVWSNQQYLHIPDHLDVYYCHSSNSMSHLSSSSVLSELTIKHIRIMTTIMRWGHVKEKEKKYLIYIAPFILRIVSKYSDMDHSFTCKLHHACLSFISVHQMTPPLTEVADIKLQLTTHLSTLNGQKAELAWLVDQ